VLKVAAGRREVVLSLGVFRGEPSSFGFGGQAASLEAIALLPMVDLETPRMFKGGLNVAQLPSEVVASRGGLSERRGELGFALRESLDLGRCQPVVVSSLFKRGLDVAQLPSEVIAGRSGLRQLGLELRLAFGQSRRRDRHRCFGAGEELFDAPASLDFLFELRLKLGLPLRSLFDGNEPFT
jgi:hypothetical protein